MLLFCFCGVFFIMVIFVYDFALLQFLDVSEIKTFAINYHKLKNYPFFIKYLLYIKIRVIID